ncbi:MAG: hypothetical protein ACT4PE_13830 [Candidatus Eiseniibacteriota bacterium]
MASRDPHGNARFRGLPREAQQFFEALDREPCPDTMPGDRRAMYAAHVLAPLKALVSDLESMLGDVEPRLGMEARVGASLFWPDRGRPAPDDCPVRRVRVWDARLGPADSPVLHATFEAAGIELGLEPAAGSADSTRRLRAALSAPGLAPAVLTLSVAGWEVTTDGWPRVSRRLRWEPWIDEPGFAPELADRFRELLPVFDEVRIHPHAAVGGDR